MDIISQPYQTMEHDPTRKRTECDTDMSKEISTRPRRGAAMRARQQLAKQLCPAQKCRELTAN